MSYAQKIEELIKQRDHWESEARKISMAYDIAEATIARHEEEITRLVIEIELLKSK